MNRSKETKRIVFIGLISFVSFIFLTSICYSREREGFKPGLSLKLTSGARYTVIGDMNTHLSSLNRYYDFRDLENVNGSIKKLNNWSADLQVELKVDFSPRVAVGFAASFYQRRNPSSITGEDIREYTIVNRLILRPEIKVLVPFSLNFYYCVYSRPRLNMYVSGGPSLWQLAQMREDRTGEAVYPGGDVYFDRRFWEVKNNSTFGFQAGIGFEYSILEKLALVTEVQGRFTRIGNLKGNVKYETNYGTGMTLGYGGTLRFFGSDYTYYDLDVSPPVRILTNGAEYIERKAILDLSGFSLRVGLRVRLF